MQYTKKEKIPDVVCLGDILMDMLPNREGVNWSEISNFSPVPGGSVANVSVGLARLGVNTAFIGKVGEDPFGQVLVDTLKQNKVNVSAVKFEPNVRTTLAFVSIRKKGNNDFVFYRNPGADMTLSSKEIDKSGIAKSKLLHFGSITITAEPSRSAALEAAIYAKKHNVLVFFDPNLRPRLWKSLGEARDTILKIIPTVDLLKMNEEECRFITDTKDLAEGAKWLLQRGPKIVVITRGEKGSSSVTMNESCFFPSYPVDVVDTVGCGDSFTAALIYQILLLAGQSKAISHLHKEKMKKILRFANAAAALTATNKGVISSLPSKDEIEKFLQEQ